MLYTREIVHSPERFEQWHLTHTILRSQSFEMLQVRQGGYGVHDIDFWVERPTGKGFSIAVLGLSGRGRFLMEDGTELTIGGGEAFISSPSGQGHREETLGPEPFEHLWVILAPTSPVLPDPSFDYRIVSFGSASLIRELARTMIREDLAGTSADDTSLDLSERLLAHEIRKVLEPEGYDPLKGRKAQLASLWNSVSQHLERPWTVNDLCAVMNCSRSHLTRLCQAVYQQSPGEKVREMKMEYAKMLLANSVMTIHEIAESAGFARSSRFSSSFLAYEGTSPREYRKRSDG